MFEHSFCMDNGGNPGEPGFSGGFRFGLGPHERPDQDFGHRMNHMHGDPRMYRVLGGFGGGRERLFEPGDFKLVVLKLLAEQPSYGYQLIKTMEQRLAGGYTPSAGVVYPTLTMLEEEGLAVSSSENNKKVYAVTPEGIQFLQANEKRVKELFDRLEDAGKSFQRGRSPEIMKAFHDMHIAVFSRVSRENITPEQIRKITEAIKAATKAIDEL
jgi:DNA-binding PadR family transcriptional regulator